MRNLVATLACRVTGTRLYGKPLQNLDFEKNITILDQLLNTLVKVKEISTVALAIAEGSENILFEKMAKDRGIPYAFGSEVDVLSRGLKCAYDTQATDIFRVTSECPFLWTEGIKEAWQNHLNHENDATVVEGLPEGAAFEIYTTDALQISYDKGSSWHRGEGWSRYIRTHRDDFKVEVIEPPPGLARQDIRLTVDYPEDLVLCRHIFKNFQDDVPLIPIEKIIRYLDKNPEIKNLVEPYIKHDFLWRTKIKSDI